MAGSTRQLILDIIARDKASADLNKVGASADRVGTGLHTLRSAALAIGGITAITAFAASSVRAFSEAETSQAKLTLAFQQFPALADTSAQRLRDLNQAMQDKAAIDADSLAAADAVLARFELTGQQIETITPLLVDYATVSGKDAASAAEALGKALLGNVRALKSLGIDGFVPTGDRARDLAALMGQLQEKVGGAGEAFAGTTAGKVKSLSLAFQDLQENVGQALLPGLEALVGVVKPIAGAFNALPEPIRATAVAVGLLGAASLVAAPKVLELKAAVAEAGGLSAVMRGGLSGVVGLLSGPWAAAILAAGGVIGLFAQYHAEATARVNDMTTALQGGEKAAIEAVATAFAPFEGTLTQLGSSLGEATRVILAGGDAVDTYKARLQDAAMAQTDYSSGDRELLTVTDELIGRIGAQADATADARGELDRQAAVTRAVAEAMGGLAGATDDAADAAAREADKLKSVSDAFAALNGLLSKRDLLRDYRDGLEDLSKTVEENGNHWRRNTEAGRENQSALDAQVRKAIAVADTYKTSRSKLLAFNEGLDEIQATLEASGLSPEQAAKLLQPFRDSYTKAIGDVKNKAGAAGDAGYAVGSAAGAGMAAGLNAWLGRVVAAANALAAAASAALRTALDSHSPSRVTWAIGEMFAEGFIQGLTSKTGATEAAADRWVEALKTRIDKRVDAIKTKLDDARDALRTLRDDYWSVVGDMTDTMREFGSLTGFDVNAAHSAQQGATAADAAVAQAERGVAAAREAQAAAATDEERATAAERLAAAEQALAEALKEQTAAREQVAATAVTGANIRRSMAERLQRMKDFAAALKQLRGLGLNRTMLAELLDAGPVDGLEMARALLDAGLDTIGELNVAQGELDTVSRDIGRIAGSAFNPEFAAQVTAAQSDIARLQAQYTELARIQKVVAELHIDGKKLVETLIRYRREHGDQPLGLE